MSLISKTLLMAGALGLAVAAIPAQAEQGDWILRGGATMVSPKSGNYKIGELGVLDIPDLGLVSVDNASLEVDDGTSLGLTVTYMLTDNWAIDLLAAVPFKHDIKLKSTVTLVGTGESETGSLKAAETKHLPPTVSLQYHFLPESFFSPYIGVGLNWTMFMSEKFTPDIATLLGVEGLSLDDSFGVAAQVGADFNFAGNWLINVDIRYIDISTKAKIKVEGEWIPLGDAFGLSNSDVSIDPIVYSIMVGYRF